ncbi:MAG: CreA protein [Rhodoferax sp.]|jgi:CreA protein
MKREPLTNDLNRYIGELWKRSLTGLHGLAAIALLCGSPVALSETVGEVSTTFKLLSPNDKVVVDVFDDPAVQGVACYLSHAKTGGFKGAIGLAEDTSDAAVACRQVGPIAFKEKIAAQEEVFSARSSILFKQVRVVRMVDAKRNTLVYLVYSNKLIDGSPKNSVTAVAVPATQPIPLE